MHSIKAFQIAVSKAIPEALVIVHNSDIGLRFQRGDRMTMVPEFVVCRGFIVASDCPAPVQEPPLTEDAELDANVNAILDYHKNMIQQCVATKVSGPFRTLISVNERSPLDGVRMGVWTY